MIGNHTEPEHAREFLSNYLKNFDDFNYQFSLDLKKNKINVILEEFTDFSFREKVKKMKKNHPKTKFLVLFSEHLTKFEKSYTFNYFDDLTPFDFQIYMKKRFLAFEDIINSIDVIFALDEQDEIDLKKYYEKKVLYLIPFAPLIKNKNQFGVGVSGEFTPYRKKKCEEYKKEIYIKNNFDDFIIQKSHFIKRKEFLSYSIHIPKNEKWFFHSVIKYILSITNSEIPFISKKLPGKIANLLCLNLDKLNDLNKEKNYEFFLNKINNQITEYQKFFIKNQTRVSSEIKKLI